MKEKEKRVGASRERKTGLESEKKEKGNKSEKRKNGERKSKQQGAVRWGSDAEGSLIEPKERSVKWGAIAPQNSFLQKRTLKFI